MSSKLEMLAARLVKELAERGEKVSFAESCTAGMLASSVGSVAGASAVFEGSAVSYSDRIKNKLLGVDEITLKEKSAVSSEVALQMAEGAAALFGAHHALSVTGYAGPDGELVGLVFIGISSNGKTKAHRYLFSGNRREIRESAAETALEILLSELTKE